MLSILTEKSATFSFFFLELLGINDDQFIYKVRAMASSSSVLLAGMYFLLW